MQFQIRQPGPAIGPSLLRLLNAIFPEDPVPGGKRGVNPVIRLPLADRDKGWAIRPAGRAYLQYFTVL